MENSFNNRLLDRCNVTNNRLCIGLDIDPDKLPSKVSGFDSISIFIKEIIDSTIDFCPVYKPNLAFYERFGSKGFALLESVVSHIGDRAITIADGKRGDIGNTSKYYADAIFNEFGFIKLISQSTILDTLFISSLHFPIPAGSVSSSYEKHL